jgi:hypothetical protein
LPLVILIAGSTRGAGEALADALATARGVTAVGSPTIGSEYPDRPITLRSQETLYVPDDRSLPRSRLSAPFTSGDSAALVAAELADYRRGIRPDVLSPDNEMLPLIKDLKSKHLFFDFVLAANYDYLPATYQRRRLVGDFLQFLAARNYCFAPLREAARDLATHDLPDRLEKAVDRLRLKAVGQGCGDPGAAAEQLASELLLAICEVNLGLRLPVEVRLRTGDRTLATAFEHLRSARRRPAD